MHRCIHRYRYRYRRTYRYRRGVACFRNDGKLSSVRELKHAAALTKPKCTN